MKKILFCLMTCFFISPLVAMENSLPNIDRFRQRVVNASSSNQITDGAEQQFRPSIPQSGFAHMVGLVPDEIADIIGEIRDAIAANRPIKTYKIILFGPPGGGKTSLAKVIAGELGWNFYNVLAGDLISKYQGSGNQNITVLLNTIRESQQKTVLFIDEIDGLANEGHADSNSELRRAIQALHKIDEIGEGLVCILATNDLEKIAKTIKSRFCEEHIYIGLPDLSKKRMMLQDLLKEHDTSAVNLRTFVHLMPNFDMREIQVLAKKIIRISQHLPRASSRALYPEAFFIALSMMQKNEALAIEQIKTLFSYWISRLIPLSDAGHIATLLNSPTIQNSLSRLSAQEIKQSALSLQSFKSESNNAITPEDIFVSIYYQNTKKLPDNFQIQRIIRYFSGIDMPILPDLSQDLAGNCTGEELQSLVASARMLFEKTNTQDIGYHLMVQSIILLEKKAKPFTLIETVSVTKQYTPAGSINGGFNGMANVGGTLNTNSYWQKIYKHFSIEKIALKEAADYLPIQLIGDESEKYSRLEYCNLKTPSHALVKFIVQHQIALNNMDIEQSINAIFNELNFFRILVISQASCITIRKIIQLACQKAIQAQSRICGVQDITDAFNELGFNISWYNESSIAGSKISRVLEAENRGRSPEENNETIKKEMASNAKKIALIVAGATTAYYGTRVILKKIEDALRIPSLAYKSSEKSILQRLRSWWVTSEPAPLHEAVFAENISVRFADLITNIKGINAQIKGGDLVVRYRNLFISGPSGTGKSLFAQNLAIASGMDYYMFNASVFFNEDNGHLLNELLVFAKNAGKKGVLIFIDEIELLLSKGTQINIHMFLDYVRNRSANGMFIFSTNRPDQFDQMLQPCIDEVVEFILPETPERSAILDHYAKAYLLRDGVSESFRDSVLRELTSAAIQEIAEKCSGLSGRELKNIIVAIGTFSSCSEAKIITPSIVARAIEEAINKKAAL